MTKKEFVLQVVQQMLDNPRRVLAGHGIQAAVLQTIVKRPDVMGKLASILWTLKYAKKGATGLKKAKNFQIKGYKNFPQMNMQAREDIEAFIAGLDEADQTSFNNAGNVITILMLPDTKQFVVGEEGDDVVEAVATGASVLVKFDMAVRKEYKIPGGMYLVVMFGDSAVRPAEAQAAKRERRRNEAIQNRTKKIAAIRKRLKEKKNARLEVLKKKQARLEATAYNLENEIQQDEYRKGLENKQWAYYNILAAAEEAGDERAVEAKRLMNSENPSLRKAGFALLKEINPKLAKWDPAKFTNIDKDRKKAMRDEIKRLMQRNELLFNSLATEPATRRASIRSMISKNNSKIKSLRARLGTYKSNISAADKAALLRKVHSDIESAIAEGATVTQAYNQAIAKLNATPQQKQIVKQQIVQQIADGVPPQYAVQQAIQQLPAQQAAQQAAAQQLQQEPTDTTLSSTLDIEDLFNEL